MKTLIKISRTCIMLSLAAGSILPNKLGAQSEEKSNQLGLRLGGYSGLTYRHFWGNKIGFEASLMNWLPSGSAFFSGLVEKEISIRNHFELYFGGGIFAGNYYILNLRGFKEQSSAKAT